MQTFLLYKAKERSIQEILNVFKKTALILDNKRLGKQRVEARDILVILGNKKPSWMSKKQFHFLLRRYSNHPAVKQWKDSEYFLFMYLVFIVFYWKFKGYKDNCLKQAEKFVFKETKLFLNNKFPEFVFNQRFITAHRSNLLRKDLIYYRKFFHCKKDLSYLWYNTETKKFFKTKKGKKNEK